MTEPTVTAPRSFAEMKANLSFLTQIRRIGPRAVRLMFASNASDDEIEGIIGCSVDDARVVVWSLGCDTCGYGYTVEVGFDEDIPEG
jgi:hypothetical protein